MTVNLRPLSLGEIFDRIAELYRKNFVLFAGLYAIYAGANMILSLLQIFARSGLTGGSAGVAKSMLFLLIALIGVCVMILLAGVAVAANNRAVAWVSLGEPATISGAYKSILPKARRYIWLMILIGFRIWVPLIAVGVVVGIGAGILGVTRRGAAQTGSAVLLGLIAIVGVLAAMIFAVWMFLRYSLAVPACVVEDLEAGDAIERSIELTKGARGKIFVLFLLTAVIALAVIGVTQFPFVIAEISHRGQPVPIGRQVLQQVLNFLTTTLIGPISTIGIALFYYDQRIRKEGFDIEWMMKAAGLTGLPAGAGADSPATENSTSIGDETGTAQA